LRERAAFLVGVTEGIASASPHMGPWALGVRERRATILYPLQKVARARVIPDPEISNLSWTAADGGIRQVGNSMWVAGPSNKRVALWADLLAHPFEEVEDAV
jgi:hypothetical protein